MEEVNRELERNRILIRDEHIHDDNAKVGDLTEIKPFQGIPGCKECAGEGWRKSKLTGRKKPCNRCVSLTGNCPLCGNTGRRLDKDKKCKCIYAK